MKGKIIKYFSRRGFGFIAPEGSQDEIFFHVSNYPEMVQPEIGNGVEFVLIETPKGKEATKIEVLAAVSADEPVEAEAPEAEAPEAEAPEAEAPEAEVPEAVSPGTSVLGVGDIKGVGKATEEKLRKGGFETVESIASVDADAVSEKAGVSAKVAAKIVASAKELLE
jgi:cold shock CspA family protein